MLNVLPFALVTLFTAGGGTGTAETASIPWYESIEEASIKAQLSSKPIMVDFWADWCAPCKVMESEVYTNKEFIQASEQFLAVRINADKKPAVVRKYHVTGLPTLLFTDSFGNELFRYTGAMATAKLTELLRSLPHDVTEINSLNQVLAKEKNDVNALGAMGKALRAAGLYLRSNEYYSRAVQRGLGKTGEIRQEILSQMAANYLDVEDGKHAAELLEQCLKEFPSSPRREEWARSLTQARERLRKK
jgi:thioredoxin-like negative regulator of GroEL